MSTPLGADSSSTLRVSRSSLTVLRHDHQADHQGGDRVGRLPAGGHDDQTGDHDGPRAERVREHLQERAAHVQALLLPLHQQRQRDRVGDQADQAEDHGRAARGVGRLDEPRDRLEQDVAAHPEQQQAVGERREDLGAGVPEGAVASGRAVGEVDGEQRHREAEAVRRHVCRVRDERQRVREQTADDLHDHHGQCDAECDAQPSPVGGGRGAGRRRSAVRVSVVVPSPHERPSRIRF